MVEGRRHKRTAGECWDQFSAPGDLHRSNVGQFDVLEGTDEGRQRTYLRESAPVPVRIRKEVVVFAFHKRIVISKCTRVRSKIYSRDVI